MGNLNNLNLIYSQMLKTSKNFYEIWLKKIFNLLESKYIYKEYHNFVKI